MAGEAVQLRMKTLLLTFVLAFAAARLPAANPFDERFQFIYFAALEGAFADGLTDEEVDRILRREDKEGYQHFVYACPLCMPVINALLAYRARPELYGYKVPPAHRTFGDGLAADLRQQLASPRIELRMQAINTLVKRWVERRLATMQLTPAQRREWETKLEDGRKQGMELLTRFRQEGQLKTFAPGFTELKECAVCNAATSRPLMGGR